ncbi:MAG: PqqD family protein [Oscillospiraceae bacterium]|nr:PqqD family protein [Oscillospiraceae bacterium]
MKLNKHFIVHEIGGESLLVPVGGAEFSGIVRGNKTLGALLELLKTETSEAELVAALCARFDAPEEQIASDVAKALESLRGIGAIDG